MSRYSTPFTILGHYARVEILRLLRETSKITVTELSETIDLSAPEISRHLGKLQEFSAVEKTDDRKYRITDYGRTILTLFAPLEYVFDRHKYYQNHAINLLPKQFLLRISELSEAEFIRGTGLVMLAMKELIESTENLIKIMVDQPFPFGKGEIHAKYIISPRPDMFSMENIKPLHLKSVEARVLDTIDVALAISDDERGHIYFSDQNGIDYSTVIVVHGSPGIDYILDLWEWYWDHGDIPDL